VHVAVHSSRGFTGWLTDSIICTEWLGGQGQRFLSRPERAFRANSDRPYKKMKTIPVLLVVLFGLDLPLHSQISLNPGDTYTYEFTTLPRTGSNFFVAGSRGCFGFEMYVPAGAQVRYEAFENSVADVPWLTGEMTGPSQNPFNCSGQTWLDFQGVVRFTMVSGSAQLNRMEFEVDINSFNYMAVYSTSVVPTPPPTTNSTVIIRVDAASSRHSISPEIYGVAFASTAGLNDLNSPLNRS